MSEEQIPPPDPGKQPKAEAPLAARIEAGEKATPHDLAEHLGLVQTSPRMVLVDGLVGPQTTYDWRHNAAAALHGWGHHEYHAGEPFQLTLDAYKAALEAVESPDAQGHYRPFKDAVSEHNPNAKPPDLKDEARPRRTQERKS